MSEQARQFINSWILENIQPTGYTPEGDASEAEHLATKCWREADKQGVSRGDIEAEFGDLVDHMSSEIERVNDEEVARLAAKDD